MALPNNTITQAALHAGIGALSTAAMDGDFDSARLSLAHVREMAANAGLTEVVDATNRVGDALGPAGEDPGLDLGQAILELGRSLKQRRPPR